MHKRFNFISKGVEKIFFSGILGASLSSLALLSSAKGYTVCGSDSGINARVLERLKENGIKVYPSQAAKNVEGFDALVYSAAIPENSPEIVQARKSGIRVFSRSEFLGHIISEYKHKIGVSGTHGKSTVSGMLSEIFTADKRDITSLIGAESESLCGGLRIGNGDTVIYEACEYKRSFLDFPPSLAVVLNVEKEHTDCYPTLSDALHAYGEFIKNAEKRVLNFDDLSCRALRDGFQDGENIYFSLSDKNAEVYAENICCENGLYSFDAFLRGDKLFSVKLKVPGIHNVKNALAATAAACLSGVSPRSVRDGLACFPGMKRRFEYIGECKGAAVYDDYAHHPTEIKCALAAAKALGFKRIICAFQPHTYSRTAAFLKEFSEAFRDADEVIFTDIFAAREENIYGVSGEGLAKVTGNGIYISGFKNIAAFLKERAGEGTLIITMGAGRLCEVAKMLILKN